jgi:deazaflavin-dependent oxidoreductase (nitroreductase family)
VTRLRPVAGATTRYINPVMAVVAPRLPGFAALIHTGHRTGRSYRTPVLLFRRADEYVIALGSGSDVAWVRNVIAAGGCLLETGQGLIRVEEPRVWVDHTRRVLPRPIRRAGAWLGVSEFLSLRASAMS